MEKMKEEILKEFEDLIPVMQVSTQVEPRLLNADMVNDFISQALDRIEDETRKQTVEEVINEIIAFRSGYVYDDYSSLYQKSGELWTEYAEKEGKFLEQLKSKYGIQETEENG